MTCGILLGTGMQKKGKGSYCEIGIILAVSLLFLFPQTLLCVILKLLCTQEIEGRAANGISATFMIMAFSSS